MKKIISIIIISILLTGCFDYREINQLVIINALAIDKKDEEYMATVSVVKIEIGGGGGTSTNQPKPIYFQETGKTIFECLRKMTLQSPRRLYINHISLLIAQEEIAKEGLNNIYDFLLRDQESRAQFAILLSREKTAAELLTIFTGYEDLPPKDLVNSIQTNANYYGISNIMTYDEANSIILNDGIDPVISSARAVGDLELGKDKETQERTHPYANLIIDSLGAFKEDKLVGWLTDDESRGYNFITNSISNTIISIPCNDKEDQFMNVEVLGANNKLKVKIDNEKPKFDLQTEVHVNIGELDCPLDINKQSVIEEIEKKVNKKIKNMMTQAIEHLQQLRSDALGWGQATYYKYPKYWKQHKDNWYDIYPTVEYKIKVDTIVVHKGLMSSTIK